MKTLQSFGVTCAETTNEPAIAALHRNTGTELSERGIAWRASDSLSIRSFVRIALDESVPDHSTISRTRRLIDIETHQAVFQWVLNVLAERNLLKGNTIVNISTQRRLVDILLGGALILRAPPGTGSAEVGPFWCLAPDMQVIYATTSATRSLKPAE